MDCAIQFDDVSVHYGAKPALRQITLAIPMRQIFGIIGPANSGKTTLLKCINRTLDFTPAARVSGKVVVAGRDVAGFRNVYELRRRVGMVFPLPVGLPLSIYENVAYAPRRAGIHDRGELDALVEQCLRSGHALGRSQRSAGPARHAAFRRPAAAADAGPGPFAPAGDPLPRRVLDRHRSGDDDEDRGRAAGTERADDDRAGHEPRAAGPPPGRSHRVSERRRA